MAIRNIVVGFDGSDHSKRALKTAIYLAKIVDASITTLIVIQAPEFSPLGGHPAESIAKYAYDKKADLIILGTRGLGGFKSMLLGSVAQKVTSYSKVPVMIIK